MCTIAKIRLWLTSTMLFIAAATCTAKNFALVIDAGHGGKDYGATGTITNEKTINLAVAKLVKETIAKDMKDVDIVMTRNDDSYLTLKERADIANNAGGDLFVSIHVNSIDKRAKNRKTIEGASVYTLGLHKTAANFEVAKRENSVIALDPDFSTSYEGFDPNSTESYIIFELSQNKHLGQSIHVASSIQKELTSTGGRADKGVRQAGFWVLWATGMPSVLVELDFICNPTQEKFLASADGQKKLAYAISNAVEKYIAAYTGTEAPTAHRVDSDKKQQTADKGRKAEQPKKDSTQGKTDKKTDPKAIEGPGGKFHVQILASATPIKTGSSEFKGWKPQEFTEGKWHKYYVGSFPTKKDAGELLEKVRKDFPKAYVVEY